MQNFVPIIFEASVTHLSQQGFGVIKSPQGETLFVRGVWPGDRGRFERSEATEGDYGFARLCDLLEASPEREPPSCPHLGLGPEDCFGCPWMLANYFSQLREKQYRVVYALQRIGLSAELVRPIWAAPEANGYRRRAQFKTDGTILGYVGTQGRVIAKIDHCLVLSKKLQDTFRLLKAQLPKEAWQPGPGFVWNYIDVDESSQLETLVLNRRQAFAQANAAQNEAMRHWLAKHLSSLSPTGTVLELFCGSGNFTEIAVQIGFSKILALEVGALAIEELRSKGWSGVEAMRVDLYASKVEQELRRIASEARTLVVNPPRSGMKQLSRLPSWLKHLEDIYYISCDPHSFAHDARRITRYGFQLQEVQPLDQMPHTPHVELLAHFRRCRSN